MMNAEEGRVSRLSQLLVLGTVLAVPAFGQAPVITPGGTVNSADYTRTFAPGALISIFGSNFAGTAQQPLAFPLPVSLGGVSVVLASTGEQFPLWYVSGTQINAQMPYDVPLGSVQVQVKTAFGTSATDTITVTAAAPKIFTQNFSGTGAAVATNTGYTMLNAGNPAAPGQTIVLWMNSLGTPSGTPVAGQPAPGTSASAPPETISGVSVSINGVASTVTFAGLSPGSSGLYQVNVAAPFASLTGPLTVSVSLGGQTSQANVTFSYQQLGFYYSVLGGKAVTGQTLTGASGSTSDLAFRQSDQLTWGATGYNAWTDNTGLGSQYASVPGLALTLMNGTSTVYDNNGIESGTAGTFYNNTGGGADSTKPGISDLYSMSNYFPLTFSGYFKLTASTTVTELIGYFDALGSLTLPFDPSNPYVKYRMNIFSGTSSELPTETGNFTGNIFSSDTTAGTFAYSKTAQNMISSIAGNQPKPIYRLTYTLAAPLTLPAGEYWFSHDASVRAQPAATSTSQTLSLDEFGKIITAQSARKKDATHFWLYGTQLTFQDSFELPAAITVVPTAVIEHK